MKILFKNNNSVFETVDEEILLIRACRKSKAPINFGCRIGICGTCKIKIIGDLSRVSPKNNNEKAFTKLDNERLACQCTIKGDVEIEQ